MSENNISKFILPGAILIAALLVSGSIVFYAMSTGNAPGSATGNIGGAGGGEASISIDGYPQLGDSSASVTIVEYSDFACPYCARFWQDTLPLIKKEYVDTGKVLFVYKDFPVVGGDRAAEAAHCAGEQGQYWEYHDKLFENQTQDRVSWSDSQVHRRYATELGLDADALAQCFNERRYQDKVSSSTQEAQANGANGTPSLFVNGKLIVGAQPFSVFKAEIDGLLR